MPETLDCRVKETEAKIKSQFEEILRLRRQLSESQLLMADLPESARDQIRNILIESRGKKTASCIDCGRQVVEATKTEPVTRSPRWRFIRGTLETHLELSIDSLGSITGIPRDAVISTLKNHRSEIKYRSDANGITVFRLA